MNYDFSTIKYDRFSVLLRILFSLVISSVLVMVLPLILLLVAIELGLALIKGARPPLALMQVTDRLVCYAYQLTDYFVLKDSRLPFPFSPLPPPSAQFASPPEQPLSTSDYADAEDVTIVNASSRETAPVCSLANSEDVTVSNQAGYKTSNTPEGLANSEAEQGDIELAELDGDGLDETEYQHDDLDETVLSVEKGEPEQGDIELAELDGDGLDKTEYQHDDLDKTVLSVEKDEPEQSDESSAENADNAEPDSGEAVEEVDSEAADVEKVSTT